MIRAIAVLGSTGAVGTLALDVIRRNPDRFRVTALAAGGSQVGLLAEQALEFGPEVIAVASQSAADNLRLALEAASGGHRAAASGSLPKIIAGPDAATEAAARSCDVVLNATPGAAGLRPTLAALDAGSILALANKESLIIGGDLVKARARPGQIVPVDSEHSAISQCLRRCDASEVRRLILTASGGPFRGYSRRELEKVTAEQALAHPIWILGPVIAVNCATLVNKGLELIEAHLLFGVGFDQIAVMVHPQSVIHSMVDLIDGSTLAQASPPDMRLPIALGLAWPDRVPAAAPAIDWTRDHAWELSPLDERAFPAVALARHVGQLGGTGPAVYNAANEQCASAFLEGRLPFPAIVETIEQVVNEHGTPRACMSLDDILAADGWARIRAAELISVARQPVTAAGGAPRWQPG
jgi:1-deoxy-D-xylulose-5-phosphate reductoisomerase